MGIPILDAVETEAVCSEWDGSNAGANAVTLEDLARDEWESGAWSVTTTDLDNKHEPGETYPSNGKDTPLDSDTTYGKGAGMVDIVTYDVNTNVEVRHYGQMMPDGSVRWYASEIVLDEDGKPVVMQTKALLMGVLVLKLQEHRLVSSEGSNLPLRHITVLEEAHNLLKRASSEQPTESGNLMGKSVEMLSNAIAEMRTYGEGFVIADQAPALLDMSAIRNTNTKIIMRLPDLSDRELVGRAANLNDSQITEIARLPTGVAAVYQNNWIQPVLCKVAKAEAGIPLGYECEEQSLAFPNTEDALMIAKVLSHGEKIASGARLDELNMAMDRVGLSSHAKVSVLRMVDNPPAEPRMTKLGPIMSALFPQVRAAVEESHNNNRYEPREWTDSALMALSSVVNQTMDSQVKRDIVQAIITDYVYNDQKDADALKDWAERGGLI
ncbi:MAG: ATP-binding protein [Atopobiaceae bacterium]|nr:ATP-binding protein [Atopobiaceae bacterium]